MELSNHTSGLIGLVLSGGLLTLAIWRAVYQFSSTDFSWSFRRLFHVLFCVGMIVQAISYADLCNLLPLNQDPTQSERLGYILLEIVGRSVLEVLTFSVVTALWLEMVDQTVGTNIQNCLIFCTAFLLSTSFLQVMDMLEDKEENLWVYKLHLLVEASCWLMHCIGALICNLLTTKRIISLSTFPQLQRSQQIKILAKALLPMMLCASCYGIRSFWLFAFELESRTSTYSRESLTWWVGFTWIPTLVPSLMLLYSTRKRDAFVEQDSSASAPLLLSPPGPPAEAFISFQRLNPEAFWSPLLNNNNNNNNNANNAHDAMLDTSSLGEAEEEISADAETGQPEMTTEDCT